LIQPIRRIPHYILILSDLLKHTTSSHDDFESLTLALKQVKETAEFVNESKRVSENQIKLKALETSIENLPQTLEVVSTITFEEKFRPYPDTLVEFRVAFRQFETTQELLTIAEKIKSESNTNLKKATLLITNILLEI